MNKFDILTIVCLSEDNYGEVQDYLNKFADILENRFIYREKYILFGKEFKNLYLHKKLNKRYRLIQKSNRELLYNFISDLLFELGDENVIDFFEPLYINIPIEDIEIYLDILEAINIFQINISSEKTFELFKLNKKRQNLTPKEFIEEFSKNYENFVEKSKEMHNNKISPLWWIWRDFSGEYNNYIEWLPRETLDDLIMISNTGKYQPDYTTYVE